MRTECAASKTVTYIPGSSIRIAYNKINQSHLIKKMPAVTRLKSTRALKTDIGLRCDDRLKMKGAYLEVKKSLLPLSR